MFVSAVAAVLVAFAIMALRYWLLPDIEQYHDRITSSLSAAMGSQVTIARIRGDWQGFLPHLNFTDVRILDDQGQTALLLKRIDGRPSWMSIFTAELRLARLEIDGPELLIRRDPQGKLFIGNLVLSRQGENNDLADWLLRQSNVVVRNALIVWVDDQRDAPPLVLQQVNFRIDSLLGKHSFALQAIPPKHLSTPLDVRGEFYRGNSGDLQKWRGRLFTQLDYTDVTAWRPWLDLPSQFSRGRGALRGWLGVQGGRVTQVTVDLDLRDVVTKLGEDVPEMALLDVHGRASWQTMAGGFEISTKRLAMQLQDGLDFPPTDIYFRTKIENNTPPLGGTVSGGEMRANSIRLEDLAGLAKYFPMDADQRARLDAYAPGGEISNLDAQWQGTPEKPSNFNLRGHFAELTLKQVGSMPGFSGLSGDVNGSEASGRLSISARQMMVDAPGEMREPLSFTTLIGQGGWSHENGELSVNVDNIAVANDDLAGNLFGSYRALAGTSGVLDLTGRLTRGDIRRAARYTPLIALNREGNDWLNGALLAGHTEDFRIRIKGNLSDFPPDGSKDVLFEIGGHARDAVVEFARGWPRIENISGEFLIRGNKLMVESPSATILDTHLHDVSVTIPDMMSKDLSLEIKGEAAGASSSFLKFVQKSPVRDYTDGFTDGISARGDGHLDLLAHIPLRGDGPVKVSGAITIQGNDIELGQGVPLLRKTRGKLLFTEAGMRTSGVSAEILGGTSIINVQSTGDGSVHATLKGHSDIDILRKAEPYPVLDYLHGSTDWDAEINVAKKSTRIIIKSDLQGINSSLPSPFNKRADETMLLRVEKNPVMVLPKMSANKKQCAKPCAETQKIVAEGRDVINVRLGSLLDARLERQTEKDSMVIKRGLVSFGARDDASLAKKMRRASRGKDGVWLVGDMPVLSVEGWGDMAGGASTGRAEKTGSSQVFPIAGINLNIDKLTGYGQSIDTLHVSADRRGDGLAAQLSSDGLNGEVVWEPRGYEQGSLLRARLNKLLWSDDEPQAQPLPSAGPVKPAPSVTGGQAHKIHPGSIPALDIAIENLQMQGKHIGHFELIGHPEKQDWRLRRLNITNPDGTLVGDGVWSDAEGQPKTQLNLMLDISDAGKILGRSGYPNTVKGGNGRLVADLSWAGTPDEFSYATLNGSLKLDTGKGQFLKMDPGAGKLLSVLSLQDLPKHIVLGFTDVFSEGFQFDSINGNATIRDGVIESHDFHIYGSSAKVIMNGNVDLNNETQDLKVRILPTLGDSVSMIGAFAISPVVGIGSLIVNKVLGDPLDKLASFEYNVSGPWRDPDVVKVVKNVAAAKQTNPDK